MVDGASIGVDRATRILWAANPRGFADSAPIVLPGLLSISQCAALRAVLDRYHPIAAEAATEDDTFDDEEEEVEEDAFRRSLRASSDLLMAMDSASRSLLTRCCGPPRSAPRSPPARSTRVKQPTHSHDSSLFFGARFRSSLGVLYCLRWVLTQVQSI